LQDSLGSLVPGMSGDAAVFDLREGRFVWHDMAGYNVESKVRLDTFLTVRDGSVVWREGGMTQMGQCRGTLVEAVALNGSPKVESGRIPGAPEWPIATH